MDKLGWFGYFLGCYKKYFQFSGRASRTEYWSFQLFKWLTYILLLILLNLVNVSKNYSLYLFWILVIFNMIPDLAVSIRRLHDIDESFNKWVYFVLIPYILSTITPLFNNSAGFVWIALFYVIFANIKFLLLTTQAGNAFENEYGLPPEEELRQNKILASHKFRCIDKGNILLFDINFDSNDNRHFVFTYQDSGMISFKFFNPIDGSLHKFLISKEKFIRNFKRTIFNTLQVDDKSKSKIMDLIVGDVIERDLMIEPKKLFIYVNLLMRILDDEPKAVGQLEISESYKKEVSDLFLRERDKYKSNYRIN